MILPGVFSGAHPPGRDNFSVPEDAIQLAEEDVSNGATLGDKPVVKGEAEEAGPGDERLAEARRVVQAGEENKERNPETEEAPEDEDRGGDLRFGLHSGRRGSEKIDVYPFSGGHGTTFLENAMRCGGFAGRIFGPMIVENNTVFRTKINKIFNRLVDGEIWTEHTALKIRRGLF
jgi:hypothetical protein